MILYSQVSGWYGDYLAQRSLRLVAAGTVEPISLAQARSHLRLDTYDSGTSPTEQVHPDDEMLETVYIPAARVICERISGRSFVPQVFELGITQFPMSYVAYGRNGVKLGVGPVRGVESVTYWDGSTYATMDPTTYVVDPYTDGGYIYAAYGSPWPVVSFPDMQPNAVRVRFTAGYDEVTGGSPNEFPLPADYRLAMFLALGHVYENRENTTAQALNEIPMGINAHLLPSSLVNGFA